MGKEINGKSPGIEAECRGFGDWFQGEETGQRKEGDPVIRDAFLLVLTLDVGDCVGPDLESPEDFQRCSREGGRCKLWSIL